MRDKKIEVDATLREIPAYTLGEFPIFRWEHRLDDFQTGELNRHWHSEFLFGLVTEGTLDYYYNPTSSHASHATLEKGDGVFINSGVLHGCRQVTEGSRLFTFGMTPTVFSSPVFGKLYQNIIVPVTHCPVRGAFFPGASPENRPLLRLFAQFEKLSPRQEDYELHTFELVCRIWRTILKQVDWKAPAGTAAMPRQGQLIALSEMVKFIQEHYRESICVDDIAKAAGVSRRECFRCFKELRGESPTVFLTQYRLSIAATQLATTGLPISAIAESCGFESSGYFSRLFKARYGKTPREFRK